MMKSLEEMYQEILKDKELKDSFTKALVGNQLEEFAKAQGCDAGKEEIEAFIDEKLHKTGELSDDELENAAGGGCGGNSSSGCPNCGSSSTRNMNGWVCCAQCGRILYHVG